MMLQDVGLSYLHFVLAFLVAGTLSAEAFVLRLAVDGRVARLLLRIDLFYAISAMGLILAGLARVFFGAKSAAYYAAEPFFWAKMAAFAVVGLASIMPTRAFFRWNRAARSDANAMADEAEVRGIRRWVMIELHVFALIPLFAALMARGIGL